MLFLIALVLSFCIAFFGGKALKKYPMIFYFADAIITAVIIIVNQCITKGTITVESEFVRKYLIGIFSKGAFAGALWCIVMWIGAITTDTKVGKKLVSTVMPVRGELSIFAAVVTLSHAVTYGITYLKRFNLLRKNNISFTSDFILTCVVCIALLVIMIPLAVMSVKAIRRKMKPKLWKNIQRAAYVFYALILIHVLMLYIPQSQKGNSERFLSIIVYTAAFAGYAVMRLRKLYIKKKKPEKQLVLNIVCGAVFAAAVIGVAVWSHGEAPKKTIPTQTVTNNVTDMQATTSANDDSSDDDTVVTTTVEGQTTQTTATDVTGDSTTTTTTGKDGDEETTTETQADDENTDEEQSQEEQPDTPQDEPQQQEQPQNAQQPEQPQQQATAAPEPTYVYNNGTFTGVGYSPAGYDGKMDGYITVSVTIENDVITGVSVTDWGLDDEEYYVLAKSIPKKYSGMDISGGIGNVDTVSGATLSSEGIIAAVQNAVEQARR